MCGKVVGRSEVFELVGKGGNAFSFELNAIVKSVSFNNNKFLWSKMVLEDGCKLSLKELLVSTGPKRRHKLWNQ